jgi:hypothetical protein
MRLGDASQDVLHFAFINWSCNDASIDDGYGWDAEHPAACIFVSSTALASDLLRFA